MADPRAEVRDMIAEIAQHEYEDSTTDGSVAHADYLGQRIASVVLGLFPEVWQHHAAHGRVCYVLRTAPEATDSQE